MTTKLFSCTVYDALSKFIGILYNIFMSKYQKLLIQILKGTSDKNIAFDDLCFLLEKLGFRKRIKGDHHIFYKENVMEIINLQPDNNKAKPYQVKQVRNIMLKYNLGDEDV